MGWGGGGSGSEVCKKGIEDWECGVSQGHGGAGVFEFAGQHSSVELVELHEVDQVGELGGTIVEAKEHLTVFFALHAPEREMGENT